jgi:hypothetical protein
VKVSYIRKYAQILCCELGDFPFKYLGVPLQFANLRKIINPLLIASSRSRWVEKEITLLCSQTELMQACLANIPLYLMSTIKILKWSIKVRNSHMSHFFWDNMGDEHRHHLADW